MPRWLAAIAALSLARPAQRRLVPERQLRCRRAGDVRLRIPAGSTQIPAGTVSVGTVDWITSNWVSSQGTSSLDLVGSFAVVRDPDLRHRAGTTYVVAFDLAGNPGGPRPSSRSPSR